MMLLVLLGGARALCAPPPASQRSVIITNHPSGVLELSLDRAPKLNALNGQMIETMSAEVARAKSDASVSGVLLTSTASRAFCAGGDIAGVAAMADTDARAFLRGEYLLMLALHELGTIKPVVALADGVVMGAGAGIFMAATTRVLGPKALFAMPECALGIVPDCGATDWLGRLRPAEVGVACALGGARLDAAGCASVRLATHTCDADGLGAIRDALANGELVQGASLIPRELATPSESAPPHPMAAAFERCWSGGTVGAITLALESEQAGAAASDDVARAEWATEMLAGLRRGCPTAQLAAIECMSIGRGGISRGRALGLELEANGALGASSDFRDVGVPCAVGDKRGETPVWRHETAAIAAADEEVQALLSRLRGANDLH